MKKLWAVNVSLIDQCLEIIQEPFVAKKLYLHILVHGISNLAGILLAMSKVLEGVFMDEFEITQM